MRMFLWLAVAMATAAVLVRPASAVDYRAEIVANVVDPCILAVVRMHPEESALSDDEIIRVVKMASQGSMERMIDTVHSAIADKSENERFALYDRLRMSCIDYNVVRSPSPSHGTACSGQKYAGAAVVQTASNCLK